MKTHLAKYGWAASLIASAVAPQIAWGGEESNAVMVGVLANTVGSVSSVSYERVLSPGFSIGARVDHFSYDYTDGSYNEKGSGNAIEVLFSYHFKREGFKGPYLMAALGQGKDDWNWTDVYAPYAGNGKTDLSTYLFTFGWDFALGSGNFVLRPAVTLGNWSGSGNDNTGTKTSSLGLFAGAGVSAAFAF